MANVNLQRTSWGSGELDQRMLGRTDMPTYRQGLVKMANWLPAKSGAAVMRGGMEQIKSIPTTFEADCIMPLRGGANPMLGMYNSTDQTFRVLKADGTWVGDSDAVPAEVTLFDSVTFQHLVAASSGDDVEPDIYSPVLPVSAASVTAAVDAFYDLIASYATVPNASCFKIRLAIDTPLSQDFSLAGGTVTLDRATQTSPPTVDTDSQALTLTMPHGAAGDPRPDSAVIDRNIAGANTVYVEKVVLRAAPHTATAQTKDKVELHCETSATGFGATDGSLIQWEISTGTCTILFNDDPGVLPMWAVEPNVEYDEIVVRLFRPNSDVKVYKITDTTITEDVHDETAKDLVGAVHNGKHASHGAYFEQRIIYGGGRDHRQEIVGSRSPDGTTGDQRYGKWDLFTTEITTVEGTVVDVFRVSSIHILPGYQGGHIQTTAVPSESNQKIDEGFGVGAPIYHKRLVLSHEENHGTTAPVEGVSGQAPYGHFALKHGPTLVSDVNTDLESSPVNAEGGLRVTLIYGTDSSVTIPLGRADGSIGRDTSDEYKLYGAAGAQESEAADLLTAGELANIRSFIAEMVAISPTPEASAFNIKYEMGTTESEEVDNVNADHAFSYTIDTGTTFAEVRWLQSFSGVLVVGSSAGVALCKFLNPDDPPEIRWHSAQCCARKPPLMTPLGVVAVSADKTAIYEVIQKRDLTAYSEDRFRTDKIHAIAWQQQPQQRLWAVTEAGKVHVLTVQDENGVNGWSQVLHQHSGTCTGVVVTPGDDEDDTVWFLMKYGAQSYVEKYHEAKSNLHSNRLFMDSAVKKAVGKQTIAVDHYLESGTAFGDPDDELGGGAQAHRGYISLAMVMTDGGADVVDQKLSSMFSGDPAQNRYLGSIRLFDTETLTATYGVGGSDAGADLAYGGSYQGEFVVALDFDGAMAADFITNGSITVTHTSPISGAVLTFTFKLAGAAQNGGGSHPYIMTMSDLTSNGDNGNLVTFVQAIRAIYPDGVSTAGSRNFSVELSLATPKVHIPLNMVGATGKKLYITSALAGGAVAEAAKYEIISSPATETFVDTNFKVGDDVWVGFQVIGDMELPAIEQSISTRAEGSWLGQPARVPWVVAGAEKAHAVKIGPTYDKLVEYFADATALSFTSALITDLTEPYSWTPSNSSEAIAWLAAVKAFHGVAEDAPGANLFTVSLTAGGVTESFVPSVLNVRADNLIVHFEYRTTGDLASLIVSDAIDGGATRHISAFQVLDTGALLLQISTAGETGGAGDHSLSAGFESGGTVTITRTANVALATGSERRPLPGHVTTTEPVVIRKDTPSPCTMTYMVVEATAG